MTPFFETFTFLTSLLVLFLIPGFFFLRMLTRSTKTLTPFETFLFSFGTGLGLLNFLMILLGKTHVSFSFSHLLLSVTLLAVGSFGVSFFLRNKTKEADIDKEKKERSFEFSKKQTLLFLLLLALTFGIKTIYLSHAILPTSTDLGHHMYWSKLIAETGKLPFYGERNIVTDSTGVSHISEPTPIADFIIGEHLPFAALNIISHLDFLGAFPILFLAFINILSLLALVLFSRTVAENIRSSFLSEHIFTPQNVALATLFIFGPLYTLSSPQEKFVSGGVVGNTIGNFFLPLILMAYLRAFREKRPEFLGLGFFLTFSLAYIHHLSTLMTLFALVASALLYLLFHWNTLGTILRHWLRLFLKPAPLLVTAFAFTFFFLVAMPTYIEVHAVGTALGTPTKTTRTGLSFYQITFSSGEARVALGIAGLFLLASLRTRMRYASAFLLGWGLILLVMTTHPEWLFIDIPSSRIGAYLSFPLGVLAAFALVGCAAFIAREQKRFTFPAFLVLVMLFTGFFFASGSGSYDNSQTLLPESKATLALETFGASRYLAEHTTTEDVILKDHNYITADSWMKLFFLRDYTYPLSRGFFKRYEDNPDREQCTLLMISVPNTARGEKCYTETGTRFVVVNPKFDITPFEKSTNFSRIYASEDIHVYLRTQ